MKRFEQQAVLGVVILAALGIAISAQTAAPKSADSGGTYAVDPIHSSNWFRIKHMNTTYFYGRFNKMEGTYTFDDADPAKCAVDVKVQVNSIDTNNEGRDKHLKSAEFFDAERCPVIAFKSTSAKKAGEEAYEMAGELTLHGVKKPLTVKLQRTGAGPGMKGEFRSGFETTFEIKRSDFGMTTMIGPLGDEVRLTVSIEGVRK